MDCLGHVNNVLYFRYVESGRIAYFDQLMGGNPDIWGGEGPILADIQCRFIRQLRYPAEIEVGTRTARLGGRSLTLECAIFLKGEAEPVAVSQAAIVWFNYKAQRAAQLTDRMRQDINAFERLKPETQATSSR
jgi:acyl-CoA thioester hydrolase